MLLIRRHGWTSNATRLAATRSLTSHRHLGSWPYQPSARFNVPSGRTYLAQPSSDEYQATTDPYHWTKRRRNVPDSGADLPRTIWHTERSLQLTSLLLDPYHWTKGRRNVPGSGAQTCPVPSSPPNAPCSSRPYFPIRPTPMQACPVPSGTPNAACRPCSSIMAL
jgi:hypothetical protein